MIGGVTNKQMTQNAKVRTMQRHLVDLTTGDIVYIGECADTDIAITSVRLRVENAPMSAHITGFKLGDGIIGDGFNEDSLVDDTMAASKIEGYEETFALESTLVNINIKEARGFPVVSKGSPIYATLDGAPTTGAGTITIDYFPLDENSD